MHGTLLTFAVDTAAGVAAAAILAIIAQVIRMSRTVRETAIAARALTDTVSELRADLATMRERIAALEGPRRPQQVHPPWRGFT